MRTLAYVIVREDLTSALVQSQCVDVLEAANDRWNEGQVQLIWFYRLDYLFRRDSASLQSLRQELQRRGIRCTFIPFLSLGFPVTWWLLPLVLPQWILGLLYLKLRYGLCYYHCRSYHAGVAAWLFSKLVTIRYVFDPRSPFPEENAAAGRWASSSLNLRVWKWLERLIINDASHTILVTRELADLYEKIVDEAKFRIIPNNYPSAFDRASRRTSRVTAKRYTLGYAGSFGNWNKIHSYLSFLGALNDSQAHFNMLFLVRTDAGREIEAEARARCLDHLVETASVPQGQVLDYLQQCECGVYLMEADDPRLGVKTVEYLRAGLPVIVSRHIHGAADAVHTNNLGVVWDHSDADVRRIKAWLQRSGERGLLGPNRYRDFAIEKFSPESVADNLISLYAEIVP